MNSEKVTFGIKFEEDLIKSAILCIMVSNIYSNSYANHVFFEVKYSIRGLSYGMLIASQLSVWFAENETGIKVKSLIVHVRE